MKLAICDDCQADASANAEFIAKYAKENSIDIEISIYYKKSSLLEAFEKNMFEVVFLDIYLGVESGIDIAREIRLISADTVIVFVTSSMDFMAEGFELNVCHYLCKPVKYEAVSEALTRCRRFIGDNGRYAAFTINKVDVRIMLKDIVYAEVYDNTTHIYTQADEYKIHLPLSEVEFIVKSDSFLRCHRSFLINMDCIQEQLSDGFLMNNGITIPFRKHSKTEMSQKYNEYIFKNIRNQ